MTLARNERGRSVVPADDSRRARISCARARRPQGASGVRRSRIEPLPDLTCTDEPPVAEHAGDAALVDRARDVEPSTRTFPDRVATSERRRRGRIEREVDAARTGRDLPRALRAAGDRHVPAAGLDAEAAVHAAQADGARLPLRTCTSRDR